MTCTTERRWRPILGALVLAAGLVFPITATAGEGPEAVENARAALKEWVEVRGVISREKRDWAMAQEFLVDRIQLLENEIESWKTRIAETRKSVADADGKRLELVDDNERLKETAAALTDKVAGLEDRTRRLLPRLPDPLREKIKPLSDRLPVPSGEMRLSLSDRYLNVVGILNEVNRFNRQITVTSEVHPLGNGTTAEVSVLYLGIGQGYFVTVTGDAAGIGLATDRGWEWSPANEAASDIATAIRIFQNEQGASYVRLPVRIE